MAEFVRWGILGAAKIAREWVAPAIHISDRGRLVAVASRTPGKAEALAAPYPDVRLHSDYEALLADTDIDAVYIPLPNRDHVEWTAKCLDAGKHVLIEKPGAMRAADYTALDGIDPALRISEAFMVRQQPRWIRLRLQSFGDDSASIRAFGLDVVTRLCEQLRSLGAPGLHFYTMNQSTATLALCDRLGL